MDDERDFEEERWQQDDLEETNRNEAADYREEFDPAPVDSSSPDHISVDAAIEEEAPAPSGGRLAYQRGVLELPLVGQLLEIMDLLEESNGHWKLAERLVEEGLDREKGTVTVEINPFEQMALSLSLNLLGFFAPHMGDDGERLLRRVKALSDAVELTPEEEQQAAEALKRIQEKDTAAMLGISVEELYEMLEAGKDAPEPSGPELN